MGLVGLDNSVRNWFTENASSAPGILVFMFVPAAVYFLQPADQRTPSRTEMNTR